METPGRDVCKIRGPNGHLDWGSVRGWRASWGIINASSWRRVWRRRRRRSNAAPVVAVFGSLCPAVVSETPYCSQRCLMSKKGVSTRNQPASSWPTLSLFSEYAMLAVELDVGITNRRLEKWARKREKKNKEKEKRNNKKKTTTKITKCVQHASTSSLIPWHSIRRFWLSNRMVKRRGCVRYGDIIRHQNTIKASKMILDDPCRFWESVGVSYHGKVKGKTDV